MIVYKLLEERLANHPIKNFVIEGAGNYIFDIAGNLFGMVHGDEVKGWGGLPFYGLTRQDARNIRTLNVIPHVLLGHHHQPASIPIGYGEYLMSGNWVGANNLSGVVGSNTPLSGASASVPNTASVTVSYSTLTTCASPPRPLIRLPKGGEINLVCFVRKHVWKRKPGDKDPYSHVNYTCDRCRPERLFERELLWDCGY